MKANELRRTFIDYFVQRGHHHEPSASLIPHDPTLLFTVAGMVPFKPYFVGDEPAPWPRAVSVQKCVRAGGKHNDLDAIGRTLRHLTFFEMLGNFSFGDYFKAEVIPWAWDLSTNGFGFDPDRLWVTVHDSDDEAADIWRDVVGVSPDRIQRLGKDNFWQAGDTGPCGPSSEIFLDKGPAFGLDGGPAFGGDERYLEFWNLVFMQYDQTESGVRVPLPKPSIDTGAGLERVLSLLQNVDSVWDTDEFQLLLETAGTLSGTRYGNDERRDVSMRILADHARSTAFLVNDGVFPSNEDRGYVLRRIMRRAVRHAYLLDIDTIVLPVMVDRVIEIMGADYPDLVKNATFIRDVAAREEERFRQTLKAGSAILDSQLERLPDAGRLDGGVAFQLHDTYGFPLEVTQEIVDERGYSVDREGFDAAMADQRRRAREARKVAGTDESLEPYIAIVEAVGTTEFVGREEFDVTARVLLATDTAIVLDRTPFYAESGGQVGDSGFIEGPTGRAEVLDTTYAVSGLVRHRIALDGDGSWGSFELGQEVRAAIDVPRRDAIRRNHTSTHILHWALRLVLGEHVKQQGSYVSADRLRFDFTHYDALTPAQIMRVEDLVNGEVLDNAPVRHFETTKDAAEQLGAIAFFGDKYGDIVRVLEAGRHSTELCGGTHVRALGDIGAVKIVSEGSIGSNLRRIEAITGFGVLGRLRDEEQILRRAADLVGVPVDELLDGVTKRLSELRDASNQIKTLKAQLASASASDLAADAIDGVVVARRDGMSRDDLRDLALAVRDKGGARVVALGALLEGGGAAFVVTAAKDSGAHAGELLAQAAKVIQGGGNTKDPQLAVAGGKNGAGIDEALDLVRAALGLAVATAG
jgi:alanyl-tRNA synthetase